MSDARETANSMITRPCNLYPPRTPPLYSKTGVYRGILFSYFCSKTEIVVLTLPTRHVLSEIKLKLTIFTAVKNRSILHRRVIHLDVGMAGPEPVRD